MEDDSHVTIGSSGTKTDWGLKHSVRRTKEHLPSVGSPKPSAVLIFRGVNPTNFPEVHRHAQSLLLGGREQENGSKPCKPTGPTEPAQKKQKTRAPL